MAAKSGFPFFLTTLFCTRLNNSTTVLLRADLQDQLILHVGVYMNSPGLKRFSDLIVSICG